MIAQALQIMLFGMLGIFLVMGILIFAITVLKIFGGIGGSSDDAEGPTDQTS